jgi:alanine racemase
VTGFSRKQIAERGHPVWAEIDLGAIRHNIGVLRSLCNGAEVMGVVKGYAYGHGNPACARTMLEGGASRLGVARVAEALHLREAGIEAPIHVFTEPPTDAIGTVLDLDITPTVYTESFATSLSGAAVDRGSRVGIHLKIDTGMHRVGVTADHIDDLVGVVTALPGLHIEGVWSHLAVADVPDHPFTSKQLDLFSELVARLDKAGVRPRYKHVANSAATLSMPESHLDLVRCGIAAYGLWPGAALAHTVDLRPAMSVRARVNMVKGVPAGDRLSYGLNYEMKRSSKVVTVPAGYADGYGRGLSGVADVVIHGRRHKVSGTVCMDQFMVDVGSSNVEVGAVATLLGRDGQEVVSAEELAAHLGTINYEITSRIASRVPRLYLDE